MLHSYAFANFQSFKTRTEIDLTLTGKVALTHWMAKAETGDRVSKLLAVVGANGSGKTALLKPIAFLDWFVCQSFRAEPAAPIPINPYVLSVNEPVEFECVVDIDRHLWRYVLRCTPERVLHEALYQKRDRYSYVFTRDWNETTSEYEIKQQDFGFAPKEARKVRANASLIATAAQYGVPLATQLATPALVTNINVLGRLPMGELAVRQAAQYFSANAEQRSVMAKLLASWDLGLNGVDLHEFQVNDAQGVAQKVWLPFGRHANRKKEFQLPFTLESSGTQAAFVLLARLLPALESGNLALIDEFENDLHPHMLEPILDLFANPKTNPKNAQLIFTCHAVEVLNLIHKSQVMLVQKNSNCESLATRLDAISGVRNDDNFYAKYMAGAYGAIPRFD